MDAYELAQQLAEKARQKPRVSREFLTAFEYVCKYYDCPPDEVDMMKIAARNDMFNANVCFVDIYERLKA